mmetsp:Transcript_2567/g.7627  ORF Transcript_2567/g.7627 Transcript_2567/m.7627 type:complete len:191 (+) Transcript_2567:50-622(+)
MASPCKLLLLLLSCLAFRSVALVVLRDAPTTAPVDLAAAGSGKHESPTVAELETSVAAMCRNLTDIAAGMPDDGTAVAKQALEEMANVTCGALRNATAGTLTEEEKLAHLKVIMESREGWIKKLDEIIKKMSNEAAKDPNMIIAQVNGHSKMADTRQPKQEVQAASASLQALSLSRASLAAGAAAARRPA